MGTSPNFSRTNAIDLLITSFPSPVPLDRWEVITRPIETSLNESPAGKTRAYAYSSPSGEIPET